MDDKDKRFEDDFEQEYEEEKGFSDSFFFGPEDEPKDLGPQPDEELITPLYEDEYEDEEGEPFDESDDSDDSDEAFFTKSTRVRRLEVTKSSKGHVFRNIFLIIAVLALIGASVYLVSTRLDTSALIALFPKSQPKVVKTEPKVDVSAQKAKEDAAKEQADAEAKKAEDAAKEQEKAAPVVTPKVRVLNGNGLTGEAERVAGLIKAAGSEILETGNADKHTYEKTLIAAKSAYLSAAKELSAKLGNEYGTEAPAPLPEDNAADIQIILGAPAINAADYKIAVLNGNNIKGEAAVIANHLKAKGWQVVRQENADRTDYANTVIKHKPNLTAAAKIAKSQINTRYPAQLSPELAADAPEDIVIILGRDKR